MTSVTYPAKDFSIIELDCQARADLYTLLQKANLLKPMSHITKDIKIGQKTSAAIQISFFQVGGCPLPSLVILLFFMWASLCHIQRPTGGGQYGNRDSSVTGL